MNWTGWVDRRGRRLTEGFRDNGAVPENLPVSPRSDCLPGGDPSAEESLRRRMEAASDAAGPGGSGSGSALEWALVDIWPMAYAEGPPRSIGMGPRQVVWLRKSRCIGNEPSPRMERQEANHPVRANRSVMATAAERCWVAASSFARHMMMALEASGTWLTVGMMQGLSSEITRAICVPG